MPLKKLHPLVSYLQAFNTFIDDIFAFIITMPTSHRLACFRDDVVFLVYLYQRWYAFFSLHFFSLVRWLVLVLLPGENIGMSCISCMVEKIVYWLCIVVSFISLSLFIIHFSQNLHWRDQIIIHPECCTIFPIHYHNSAKCNIQLSTYEFLFSYISSTV